jgi:hypothetical protein
MMKCRHILPFCLLAVTLSACRIDPPLHLRKIVDVEVELEARVDIDIMWQVDWEAEWEYAWNVETLGPLGYEMPASMRVHTYTHDADGALATHQIHNFAGQESRIQLTAGTYDFLFHNNDSEAILFKADGDLEPVHAYTRKVSSGLKESSPVYTTSQKLAGFTKAGDEEEDPVAEPVNLMPDDLFSLYDPNQKITDNPNDYIFENGKYVLKIEGVLEPSTFIYLVQVNLLNNAGRVIGSAGGGALTGMAEGVNLVTRETWSTTASVFTDVYMDKAQDMMGVRFSTFGIPGCNPYDDASVAAAPQKEHYFVLNVSYSNGSNRNIRMDITDQLRALPLGGVINLEIDVNDFPPGEGGGSGGGGFEALIGGWDEEVGSTTIIN